MVETGEIIETGKSLLPLAAKKRISLDECTQQLAVSRVMAQLPEHHAAQMLPANVRHFLIHRLRAVVAPEITVVPHAARGCLFIVLAVRHAGQLLECAISAGYLRR